MFFSAIDICTRHSTIQYTHCRAYIELCMHTRAIEIDSVILMAMLYIYNIDQYSYSSLLYSYTTTMKILHVPRSSIKLKSVFNNCDWLPSNQTSGLE